MSASMIDPVDHEMVRPVRSSTGIFGHDASIKQLEQQLNAGQFHHAWLFHGSSGIGKASLAYLFAKFMYQVDLTKPAIEQVSQVDHELVSAKLIESGAHPDVYVLERGTDPKTGKRARFITIDDMRTMKRFLSTTSSFDSWRIVIIDKIDDANIASLNGLLKIFEEPPHQTVFFAISDVPGKLPITIRSRCCRLGFDTLSPEAFSCVLEHAGSPMFKTDYPDWGDEALYRLANGSPGKGFSLLESGGYKYYDRILNLLLSYPHVNNEQLHGMIDQVYKDTDLFTKAMEIYQSLAVRLLRHYKCGESLPSKEQQVAAHLLHINKTDISTILLTALEDIEANLEDISLYNLDKKSFFMGKLLALNPK